MGIVSRFGESGAFITPSPEQDRAVRGWRILQVMSRQEQRVYDDLHLAGFHPYMPMETHWRPAKTREAAAKLLAHHNRREAALEAARRIADPFARKRVMAGIERSLPRVSSMAGANFTVEDKKPYMPGYLFLAAYDGDDGAVSMLKPTDERTGIAGVIDIMRYRSTLGHCMISDDVMRELMRRERDGELGPKTKRQRDNARAAAFQAGQRVSIVSGPFAQYDAVVSECRVNERIKAFVMIFGRESLVDLDAQQIEAVA